MDDVSPIMTQEAGAGPRQNRTETIRPRDAVASDAEFEKGTEPAIPMATKTIQLKAEPHR